MRIKPKREQLEILAKQLRFEVMLEQPRDVRGMLVDIMGKEYPEMRPDLANSMTRPGDR